MFFHNKAGQSMNLVDNLTIKELLEMGVELTLSETFDPDHEFHAMNLAETSTIKELVDMGVELTLSETIDPEHELWLADKPEGKNVH